MTIINTPTPIIINNPPPEDPECPHCGKKLPGWSEPSDTTWKEIVVGALLIVFIFVEIGGALIGGADGLWQRCDSFFSKRYHYIVPTYPIGCNIARWLDNKE